LLVEESEAQKQAAKPLNPFQYQLSGIFDQLQASFVNLKWRKTPSLFFLIVAPQSYWTEPAQLVYA
jgi:hypothetical protein